jgi:uncharacterized protein
MSTHVSPRKTSPPAQATDRRHRYLRWSVAAFFVISMLLTITYTVISGYIATQLVKQAQLPFHTTPADYHLPFRDVSFTSREDHLPLVGWFLPGRRPDGSLTTQHTIIMVHGYPGNRATESVGMLAIANGFVHHGFAVLTFDLRAAGKSAPAPESMGYFEQRDVLGAVDFLQSGPLPYPELGRPQAIVGWGVSMGAATLLLAAAREPAIRAVVTDCAYGDLLAMLRMSLPNHSHVSPFLALGIVEAAQAIYGVNLTAVRPVDVVKNLAPRPVFFIQDDNDHTVPPAQMEELANAARSAPGAHVQTWMITGGVEHAQSFLKMGEIYINRIVDFYTAALGPKTGVVPVRS